MKQKTKTVTLKSAGAQLHESIQTTGLLLMAFAATLGMIELPEHLSGKIAVATQPAFSVAGNNSEGVNTIRREREEAGPHYVSYSVAQRTPGRTGRI